MAFLLAKGAAEADAVDVVQDAFVELYRRIHDVSDPTAYVWKAALNRWRKQARLVVRRRAIENSMHPRQTRTVADVHETLEVRLLLAAMAELSPRQQEVLALHVAGFSTGEIAHLIGRRAATVRATLRDARIRLQAMGHVGQETI